MSAVDVNQVSKSYGVTSVLSDISIAFESGKFTSLLGPSGSGKTTLLRIVAGFVRPDAGSVSIAGKEVSRDPVWKRDIGMVFQSYALFPHMTVAENVEFGLNRRGMRGSKARGEVARALEMVRLTGFDDRKPKQLSGGQQQRVALARAIVIRPKVLLLDEPLSALDRRLRQEMQVELHRIQRESGLTTIFVTHDQEEALTLSDRVAILDRGRIVQEDTPSAIYEQPKTRFAAGFLGDANFLAGEVRDGAISVAGLSILVAGELPNAGSKATVAVRPEKIAIASQGALASFDNEMTARVREIIYAGATTTYLLDGPAGLDLRVFSQNREDARQALGAAVKIGWSRRDSVVLDD